MKSEPLLSVVIPAYNEARGIGTFHEELLVPHLTQATNGSYEILYINDGSSDDSLQILTDIAASDTRIKLISISRNFGKEIATSAGIKYATGKAVIIMDSDGQHPPELISDFITKWREGAQVIVGVRGSNQNEGAIKKLGSKMFYRLFNGVNDVQMQPGSTDFRLMDRSVQQEFIKLPEHNRITRGLIDWLGFKRDYIYFNSPARLAGAPSYSSTMLIGLALNSFVSLSLKPLFMLAWTGFIITLLAMVAGIFMLVEQLVLGDPLKLNFTGAALLGIFVSFLVGLVLTSQGVLAIYLSHIHTHAQGRPLFVVDRSSSIGIE